MVAGITYHLRAIIGLGLVTAAVSELLFYPAELRWGLAELVLVYGMFAWTAVLAVHMRAGGGMTGLFAAATVMGLLVEGVPVFELYAALPLSLFWTSIGWHGVITGVTALFLLRWSLHRNLAAGAMAAFGLGVGLGLWCGHYWTVDGTPPGRFWPQLALGSLMLAVGHAVLPHAPNGRTPWARGAFAVLGGLVTVFFCLAALPALFPVSLVLPASVAAVMVLVPATSADPMWAQPARRRCVLIGLVAPGCAVGFVCSHGLDWARELNVWVFVTTALLATLLTARMALTRWRGTRHNASANRFRP